MAKFIEVNLGWDGKVAVFLPEGRQPYPIPIIALHGNWATWKRYAKCGPWFADRGYAFLAPTYTCHRPNNGDDPHLGKLSIRDYAKSIGLVMDLMYTENLVPRSESWSRNRPILIGHSMGGTIAQLIASQRKISGLVLLNSAPVAGISLHANTQYQRDMIPYLRRILRSKPYLPARKIMSEYVYNGMPPETHEDIYRQASHESGTATREILAGSGSLLIRSLARLFSRPIAIDAQDVQCPVLIIGCRKDRVTPDSIAWDLFDKYGMSCPERFGKNTTLKIFDQFAHWAQYEEGWEASAEYILKWIRQSLK